LYKQHDSFTEDLAKRLNDIEQYRALTTLMLENMKDDITEIKSSVTKLVDREYAKNKR
jgi:hypothetical protein